MVVIQRASLGCCCLRRDVCNGFLVAEVFSRYFPADIQMHSFANATSSHFKRDNWNQLLAFATKQGVNLPAELVEGSLQGVHGAAIALLEHLYEVFTGKRWVAAGRGDIGRWGHRAVHAVEVRSRHTYIRPVHEACTGALWQQATYKSLRMALDAHHVT